jgi:hypothetical protein
MLCHLSVLVAVHPVLAVCPFAQVSLGKVASLVVSLLPAAPHWVGKQLAAVLRRGGLVAVTPDLIQEQVTLLGQCG